MDLEPTEFHWILAGRLAGSARPGFLGSTEEDLKFLQRIGIRLIVTLTESPLPPLPAALGMHCLHFPVPDMGVPTLRSATWLCRLVLAVMKLDQAVLLHCKAGLGRTGTLLACCLVARGSSPEDAIRTLRAICRGYVQSEVQEDFVSQFAELNRSPSPTPPEPLPQAPPARP
jgi:atypical dual specificity phosphatase